MKRIIILMTVGGLAIAAHSQTVTFYSSEFENGVKTHLGIDSDSDVTQDQTDTITMIDLSQLGITDIRDVCYLPNVSDLNLSGNSIRNISPLLSLDSLRRVDLSWNKLENIDLLAFTEPRELTVNIGYNYIQDFGYLMSSSASHLVIIGMGGQRVKDAPYFDVYYLCGDVNAVGKPVVNYRGYTNTEADAYVECGTMREQAKMDGDTYTVSLLDLTETSIASVGNGEKGDTTYVVPAPYLQLDPGQSYTYETGLPEGYTIRGYSPALQGTMQIDGTKLIYSASEDFNFEEYTYAYYDGGKLKGYSQITYDTLLFILGDANHDGKVRIGDATAILNHIVGVNFDGFNMRAADVNEDGKIRIGDVTGILNIIVGQ